MRKIAIVGAVIFICIILCGCSSNQGDKDKFVGTWKPNSGKTVFTFFSDGTFTGFDSGGTPGGGTWMLKDGNLVLYANVKDTIAYKYAFSDDGKNLFLSEVNTGYSFMLTKQ
jgi:hypothetical protein